MQKYLSTLLIVLRLTVISFAQAKDVFKQSLPSSALLKPTLKVKTVRVGILETADFE